MSDSKQVMHSLDWTDTAVTAVFLIVGVCFLYFSFTIDESLSGGGVGPRLVPQVISAILILIASCMLIKDAYQYWQYSQLKQQQNTDDSTQEKLLWSVRLLPLQILLLSAIYVAMFQWFGYLLATVICAIPIYVSFGNRNLFSILVLPAIVIAIFYSVFFGVMGLYDLPGSLIDTTQWVRWS